jgi:hypothetical protein
VLFSFFILIKSEERKASPQSSPKGEEENTNRNEDVMDKMGT